MLHFAYDPDHPNKPALCKEYVKLQQFLLQMKLRNGSSRPFAKTLVPGKKLFSNDLDHLIKFAFCKEMQQTNDPDHQHEPAFCKDHDLNHSDCSTCYKETVQQVCLQIICIIWMGRLLQLYLWTFVFFEFYIICEYIT